MLERFFSRSLARYTASPHATDLDAFAATLVDQGRCPQGHVRRLWRVLFTAKLAANSTIGVDQLRDAFAAWPAAGYVGTHRLFRCYLRDHGRLGAPAPPRLANHAIA